MSSPETLRPQFLIDPSVTFLNHGSFGACPAPVFAEYQRWQRELEFQPVEFLGRRANTLLDSARLRIAQYVNADPESVVFVPNATAGLNTAIRSLALAPGDEILTTDHEYGALEYTWNFVCAQTGATLVRQPVALPVTTTERFVEDFWQGVTERTKVIFLSHITSPTALTFPIEPIIARAKAAGIITIVDGAHAPGHVPLDMTALGADFYSGNFHKWLCAPKGSAFLYAAPPFHQQVAPPVISWGWSPEASFVSKMQMQATRDIASYLATPAAIDFLDAHDWPTVRLRCHALASEARSRVLGLTEEAPIQPDSPLWFGQMVTLPLPPCDVNTLKSRMIDEYRIEAPTMLWHDRAFIRVAFQGYNSAEDIDRLMEALTVLLPQVQGVGA